MGNDDVIEIEKLLSMRTKPRTVAETLKLCVKTVRSFANNHRQRILGRSGNVTTRADWDAHFNPLQMIDFEDKDKAFVLAYRSASEVDDLIILFSTPRLMERLIQELDEGYRYICVDGTFKLNWNGYPCIIMGTCDWRRKFFPGVYGFVKSESTDNFKFYLNAVETYLSKYYPAKYATLSRLTVMADDAGAFRSGFMALARRTEVLYKKNKIVTSVCFFHLKKAVLLKFPTINGSKEHMDDLDSLAHVPFGFEELFNKLEQLFITKWESKKISRADAFITYYKSQWKGKKWSRAFLPEATPQTNNGAKSHNKHYKERFLTSRPSLYDACANMISDVEQISSDFANEGFRGKSEHYLVTQNHWKQAKIYQKELNESNYFFPFHENDDTEAPPAYVLYPSTKHIKDVTEEHEQKDTN